jgi:sialidase-1
LNSIGLGTRILIGGVLCSALSSADEPQRLAADVHNHCLALLREAIKSDEFWPAMHAAEALTLAGHGGEVVAALRVRLMAELDDQRRCGLARELVRAGDRSALPVLLDVLSNPASTGRVHAAESLFKLGEAGDKTQLRTAFQQTEQGQLQLYAMAALARTGESDALQKLREKLQSTDRATRVTVAFTLAQVGGPQDTEPLLKTLDTETDNHARAVLVNALASLGHPKGKEELLRNLDSTDTTVRTTAAEIAGHARCVDCMAKLIRLLNDSTLDTRIRAAHSLIVLSRPSGKR